MSIDRGTDKEDVVHIYNGILLGRQFSSVQSLSHIWLFATPWNAACQASLSITNFWRLLKLVFIELMMPSHPLSPPSPLAFSLFQWISSSRHVAKVLEFQLQHQSFQWIFRVDFNPIFKVGFLWDWPVWSPCCPRDSQGSSAASQFESTNSLVLSLLYGPDLTSIHDTGKTTALTVQTFVSKVMSLLFIHCLYLS